MLRSRGVCSRAVALAAAVVVAALVSVSCGDSSPEASDVTAAGGAASGELVVLGPGTPIAAGFVVPDDAVLLAPPIPTEDGTGDDRGWVAQFRPRDPVTTFEDLVGQAQELGFEVGSPAVDPCFAVPDERTVVDWSAVVASEPFPDGVEPKSIACTAIGYRDSDGESEEVFISTEQFLVGATTSQGSISVGPPLSDPRPIGTGQFDLQPLVPTQVRPASAEVAMEPPDFAVGDALDPMAGPDGPTLIAGSRLSAPRDLRICQGGFFAPLDVTGDPDEVFAGYVDHVRSAATAYGAPVETTSTTLFSRRIERAWATIGDDSSMMTATMVVGIDGEPTRVLFERCGG